MPFQILNLSINALLEETDPPNLGQENSTGILTELHQNGERTFVNSKLAVEATLAHFTRLISVRFRTRIQASDPQFSAIKSPVFSTWPRIK